MTRSLAVDRETRSLAVDRETRSLAVERDILVANYWTYYKKS
jgi:hypothetical protein